jgi:catechol 2,3-dioxygenase
MSDHGVSEAIYLKDPDGNGIEISADRPMEKWPLDSKGNFLIYERSLDYDSLLSELTE